MKVLKWNRTRTLTALLLIGVVLSPVLASVIYQRGYERGYRRALTDISDLTGLTFEWSDLGNGRYEITVIQNNDLVAEGYAEVHLWVEHYRDGELLSQEYGAGILSNIGKDWIEQQLAASDGAEEALYCADSNDASAPSAAWTELPNEIAANGLDRQAGAYTSTGVGTWNVSVTKPVTGTQSTQLWGLHWDAADESDNNLLAIDGTPAQKNCDDGDSLKETWQIAVTG